MNDIKYTRDNFQFIYRVSALIYNKDKTKILLYNVEGRDFYMLVGGKVHELEKSEDAIKREVIEETGFDNINFKFLALSEDYVYDKDTHNQQIEIIYEGVYDKDILNEEFKGLDGDWSNFKWVNITDLDNYIVYPKKLKEIINSDDNINHIIEGF